MPSANLIPFLAASCGELQRKQSIEICVGNGQKGLLNTSRHGDVRALKKLLVDGLVGHHRLERVDRACVEGGVGADPLHDGQFPRRRRRRRNRLGGGVGVRVRRAQPGRDENEEEDGEGGGKVVCPT